MSRESCSPSRRSPSYRPSGPRGRSGAGKSYLVKLELLRRLAHGRTVAVIVDDDAEVIRTMSAAGYPTFRATWEGRSDDDELSVAQDELGRT